jgi:membrane associated rhomboid family serine protease
MIALGVIYVGSAILQNFLELPVFPWLALNPSQLGVFTVWQAVTHVMVVPPESGSLFPLLLSLLFMWWILSPFEDRYGRDRLLQLCVLSAVAAALPAILVGQVMPRWSTLVAGPQTLTLAGMCAYATVLPSHAQLSFFGLFTMRPKQLIYVVVGLSVVSFLTSKNAAQLAADLGAVAAGIGFVQLWMTRPPRKGTFNKKKMNPKESGRIRLVKKDEDENPKRWLN